MVPSLLKLLLQTRHSCIDFSSRQPEGDVRNAVKQNKGLKKDVKKDPQAVATEFKTMLRQLWPLTQTVQPDTADMRASGAALQASARAGLISSFLGMQGDLKQLQGQLLTGTHKHRPFHTYAPPPPTRS